MYGYYETGYGFCGKYHSFRIEGLREMTYYGYTKREAESKYRKEMGLTYRHIDWIDMSNALAWLASK